MFAGVKLVSDTMEKIAEKKPMPGLVFDTKPARAMGVLEGVIRKTTPDRGAKDNVVTVKGSASPFRRTQYGSVPYSG